MRAPWPALGDASTTSVLPSAERCAALAAAAGLAQQAPRAASSSEEKTTPSRAIPNGLSPRRLSNQTLSCGAARRGRRQPQLEGGGWTVSSEMEEGASGAVAI